MFDSLHFDLVVTKKKSFCFSLPATCINVEFKRSTVLRAKIMVQLKKTQGVNYRLINQENCEENVFGEGKKSRVNLDLCRGWSKRVKAC